MPYLIYLGLLSKSGSMEMEIMGIETRTITDKKKLGSAPGYLVS